MGNHLDYYDEFKTLHGFNKLHVTSSLILHSLKEARAPYFKVVHIVSLFKQCLELRPTWHIGERAREWIVVLTPRPV